MRALRGSGIALLAALLVLPAIIAVAGQAEGKPPATTTTTTEPTSGGHTCAELGFAQSWDPAHELTITETGFSFKLRGSSDGVCVDVYADGPWHVTGTSSGVSSLSMIPRDSASPGDSCGGIGLKRPAAIDLFLPTTILSATVNSCGLAFGEWIDGVLVTTQTGQSHPLAFIVQSTGKSNASATIEVQFPQSP